MKKSIVMIACVSITLLHGMKQAYHLPGCSIFISTCATEGNRADFQFYNTKIIVCKGSIVNAGDVVDVIVVGQNQQNELSKKFDSSGNELQGSYGFGSEYQRVGRNYFHGQHCLYAKYKISEIKSTVNSEVLVITEPCITIIQAFEPEEKRYGDVFQYSTTRKPIGSSNVWDLYAFTATGKHAISEALKDLEKCYTIALDKGLTKGKSIAFTTLSTDQRLPSKKASAVAVKAVVDYINNNKNDSANTYNTIFLYVTKKSEFIDYKTTLFDMFTAQK